MSAELKPNTPITQENVALLKAGDIVMVVAPNHGEWTGGEWPVTKVGNVWADLKHPRFGEGMFFAQELVFVRPALAKPAEGETKANRQAEVDRIMADANRLAGRMGAKIVPDKERIEQFVNGATPTPPSVDWERVGPKLVKAAKIAEVHCRHALALMLVEGRADQIAKATRQLSFVEAALAATQPQSNGD